VLLKMIKFYCVHNWYIFGFELLIIFGLPCTLQSTPCEHWTTVKNRFLQHPMKGGETGICQNR